MIPQIAGILFDQSVLRNPIFITMSILVAFNTLVYLGLTGSRMLWWFRPKVGLRRHEAETHPRSESPSIADVLPPPRHILAEQRQQSEREAIANDSAEIRGSA